MTILNPLNLSDLNYNLRSLAIIPRSSYKANALIIPANCFIIMESLNVRFHKPVWMVKSLNIFKESMEYGKYLFQSNSDEEKISFQDWLLNKEYFDVNRIADIKKDIVSVYNGPFNFFCFGNQSDYNSVISACPSLVGDLRNFLFSTVRVYESLQEDQKAILLNMLKKIENLQLNGFNLVLVDLFKKYKDVEKLAVQLDPKTFNNFSSTVKNYELEKIDYRLSEMVTAINNYIFSLISKLKHIGEDEKRYDDDFAEFFSKIEIIEFISDGRIKPFLIYQSCLDQFKVNFYVKDVNYVMRRSKAHFASILEYLNKNKNTQINEKIKIVKRNETVIFTLVNTERSDEMVPAINGDKVFINNEHNVMVKILSAG